VETIQTIASTLAGAPLSILIIVGFALVAQSLVKTILHRSTAFIAKKDIYKNAEDRQKRIKTINSVITAVALMGVWLIAALMILQALGIATGPIVASLSILGAAVAFGTQSIIRDFVSGLFIIAEDLYHIDDYVEIGSISGKVESVSVRTTTVRGEDGSTYYIPNGSVTVSSNKSVGPLKEFIELALEPNTNLTTFAKELSAIEKILLNPQSGASLVQKGPSLSAVTAVSAKTITVNITYTTTASKRKSARSAVLREVAASSKKGKIKLH
jgi:moderate conductance mechanosensitive channel